MVLYQKLFQIICVLGIGGSFSFGFQISMITYASVHIKKFINETWQERYHSFIDEQSLTLLWSSIVSAISIGGLLGTISSRSLSTKYGKSGQFLGEISPKQLRGYINTSLTVFVTMGKFLGQMTGLRELLGTESLWPLLTTLTGIAALVQLVTLPFLPESPLELLMQKGDTEGCLKAAKQLWGKEDRQAEIDSMLKEQAAMKNTKLMTVLELLKDRSLRWQFYLMIIMGVTLQLSGINAIYFYSFEVFHTAGFDQEHIPYISLGLGTCEFFSSILCAFIIEQSGRRMFLLWGYGLMILVLALLTTTLTLQHQFFWMPYCSVILIFLFIIIFGNGPAGVTFPVISELFTQSSRLPALMICMSLHWAGLCLIGMVFPYVVKNLGTFCFLVFMGFISVSWISIYRFLPETKNKSIMEIKAEFHHLNFGKACAQVTENNPPEEFTACANV
ncbi:hypothetical protein Y1Q_0022736 [Alligator mississippiensis]|uniref:Major facilitator superfamily (MFS) profile domain-containing protein n=1 Tax=Alligator mississippiensis TaxID=8496 RepID=A0A151N4A3_ALLMI|nr:hypothetical protein Y1Q_0022736 [Alligator mississippiensis]